MSSPEAVASMLISYYVENGVDSEMPLRVAMTYDETDTEYITEILLSIYIECNKLYNSGALNISQTVYAECLSHVFLSINYMIKTELCKRDKLHEVINFIKIQANGIGTRNPYHPFTIRENCINAKLPFPDTMDNLYYNTDMLSDIVNIHDADPSSDSVLLIKFLKYHHEDEEEDVEDIF
uniref:Uncharacterized protein n=1 Tax=viral metagenome TaxID=1070528 RepID=A0A6C0J488_9ZZZZ